MVTRLKPDYTFGELGGIDDLASLGIEIQDDVPTQQEERRARPDPSKVRRLRETLTRWTREQEDKLIAINPQAVANDRATAEALGLEDLLPEYDDILARNESVPGRIRDRLDELGKDLPQAKLGKYGNRGVWWAEIDPLTHRWVVPADQNALASGDLVVGMFNGQTRAAVIDKPEDIADGVLLDAGSDMALGNRVGRVLERFGEPYRDVKRRHESGELRQQWEEQEALSGRGLPEPQAAPAATDAMMDEAGDAPASEDAGGTQYSDAIAGMAANMTAGGRLKGRNISSTLQQRELQAMAHANPELAAHLGMPVDQGLAQIPWSNLSRADAAKLIGIFNTADDYAMRQQGTAIEVAQATVRDPETGEQVVLTASKEGDGPTVVTAQGKPGELMDATEAAMVDVAERSAAPSEPDGDTEGSGFEPLPEGYDLSAYGFGDKDDESPPAFDTDGAEPEPPPIADGGGVRVAVPIADESGQQQAEFEGYKVSDNFAVHPEAITDPEGKFIPGERWSITYTPTGALLLTSESNLQDTMAFASRLVPLIDRDNADDVRAAVTPDIRVAIDAISNRRNNLDKALQNLHQASRRPVPDVPPPSDMAQTDVDLSDPQSRQQWAAGILKDQWFERSLAARQSEYSGNIVTRIEQGMDVPWVGRHELAKQYVESLIGPPDAAKGQNYSFRKQRELHQKLQALAAAGQETASAPDAHPETPDTANDETTPASEPSAEASEPEPEAPALAPVLADAEPGPAEPPAIITPTTGKGPAELPQVANVSRNDTAEQLQQKWRQADQSIDAYAKSFGISGIPDDAARLELRPDGSIGVERLRVTPQGSAYRTPARQTSGSGGGGGGGGSSSPTKASAPAIGLRKSWERISLAEKQAVIDVINDALARRALLSTALVTMTCSPTGDLSLSSGQKMATIVGSCAPRSSPVSPRQSLPDHPWLSKHEVATFGGNKRRSGQNQRAKKTKSRR